MPITDQQLIDQLRDGLASSVSDVDLDPLFVSRLQAKLRSRVRRRRVVWIAAPLAAATAAMTVVGSFGLLGSSTPPAVSAGPAPQLETVRPAPVLPSATTQPSASKAVGAVGVTLVAGTVSFSLPAGSAVVGTGCPQLPKAEVTAKLGNARAESAALDDGGCLVVAMVAPPPKGGTAVDVGRDRYGKLRHDGDTSVLTITAAESDSSRAIVFVASGISDSQLTSIARRGMGTFDEPKVDCSHGCG